ncbi:SRPBCC domain-containing protein [Okibacterium endophyticum]
MTPRPRRRRVVLITIGAALVAIVGAALVQRAHPHVLSSSIDIDAPPSTVWDVLTDFAAYPEWNPSLLGMRGVPEVGETLGFRTADDGFDVTPTVLAATPAAELRWKGHLVVVGLFDGEHRFTLEELPGGGTRLTQDERFRGILIPFMAGWLDAETLPEFAAMNAALKERAESR